MNKIKVTLPPMAEGQEGWKLYSEYRSPIGRDPWPWHHRIIWRFLLWAHGRVEKLWHWIWRIAQPFAQPRMRYETKYREIQVLDADGHTLTVERGLELVDGTPLVRRRPGVSLLDLINADRVSIRFAKRPMFRSARRRASEGVCLDTETLNS